MQADEEAAEDEMPLGLPAPGDVHDPVEDAMDAAMASVELGGFRVPPLARSCHVNCTDCNH